MDFKNIPHLGIGIGYRKSFGAELFDYKNEIDVLEVIADSYMNKQSLAILDIVAKCFKITFHSLNLSLAYIQNPRKSYLDNYHALIKRYNPAYVSDHMALTRVGSSNFEALTPFPYTKEMIDIMAKNYKKASDHLKKPLVLENISYDFKFPHNTMSEIEFFVEFARKTNCGFLFDITNLYSNCINHDYSPVDFINRFPLERIVQVHFTGGHFEGKKYVDSHSKQTPEHVWKLFKLLLEKGARPKCVILERDEDTVKMKDVIEDVRRARELCASFQKWE